MDLHLEGEKVSSDRPPTLSTPNEQTKAESHGDVSHKHSGCAPGEDSNMNVEESSKSKTEDQDESQRMVDTIQKQGSEDSARRGDGTQPRTLEGYTESVKSKGPTKPQKGNQPKNKGGNPNAIPPLRNADGYVRMNFLLQAAHFMETLKIRKQYELANVQETKEEPGVVNTRKSAKSKKAEAFRAERNTRRLGGLSRGYIAYMRKLSSRLVNRLHPETKKATCARCFSCLIPDGKYCARTRIRKKQSGLHVIETKCLACGHKNDRIVGVLKHVEAHDSKAEDDKHVITIAPRQTKGASTSIVQQDQ